MTLQEIMKRMAEINTRMAAIRAEAQNKDTTTERLVELETETSTLAQERSDLTKKSIELRSEPQRFNPVVGDGNSEDDAGVQMRSGDPFATVEYRKAFMDYVMNRKRGTAIDKAIAKAREEGGFTTSDAESVIVPTTITDLLYVKRGQAGSLFARVHKSNYPAGMAIPTINFKPKLEWVAENKVSKKSKGSTGSITFNGYKGQIRVAISLETQIKSLAQFEAAILEAIRIGIDEGFDEAIVRGTGEGQPTGILTGADYDKKAVVVNTAQIESYKEWLKIWAKVPLKGRANCHLHINKTDWEAHLLGMTDDHGRCIAFEKSSVDGALVYTFMGREVVILEDQGLPEFDSVTGAEKASKDTAFAYYFDDSKYYLNSNMQLVLRNYIDEDTDEKVHKATLIADGKVVDDDSLLVICRGIDA